MKIKSVEKQPLLLSSSQKSSKLSLLHILLGLSWCVICFQFYAQHKSSVEVPVAAVGQSFQNYDLDGQGVFYAGDTGDQKCTMSVILEIQEWKWRYWYLGYAKWNELSEEERAAKPKHDTIRNAAMMFEVHHKKFQDANKLFLQTMYPFDYPDGKKRPAFCNEDNIELPCGPNEFQWRTHMLRSPEGVNLRCSSSMHPCIPLTQPDEKWFADPEAYPDVDKDETERKKRWWYPLKKPLEKLRDRFKACNTVESWCNVVGLRCYDKWSGLRLQLWTKADMEGGCIDMDRAQCQALGDKKAGLPVKSTSPMGGTCHILRFKQQEQSPGGTGVKKSTELHTNETLKVLYDEYKKSLY